MKVLVLGAGGMLGHKIYHKLFQKQVRVYGTVRSSKELYTHLPFFPDSEKIIDHVDVTKTQTLSHLLDSLNPKWIINCIGVTTRKLNHIPSDKVIFINSYLPHFLNQWCHDNQSKLIHFSTDCVFNGLNGGYTEESPINAQDLYGLSKALGECKDSEQALTLRSSIIGREIFHKTELIEWFLSQAEKNITGFSEVYYTGVTTNTMANFIEKIINNHPKLNGLYQVASPKISKSDLLQKINKKFNLNVEITNSSHYQSDKSLTAHKFYEETGIIQPTWDQQVDDLFKESYLYLKDELKNRSAA